MAITHKDLDWDVGKFSTGGGQQKSSTPIGAYDPNSKKTETPKKKTQEEQVEIQRNFALNPQAHQTRAIIQSAKLLPISTTDFNKACKFRVEICSKEGYSAPITVELWGKYGKSVNRYLSEVKKVNPVNMVAEGEVTLFYIDEYYNDAVGNNKNVTCEYYLKVTMKGASDKVSDLLMMPQKKLNADWVFKLKISEGKDSPFANKRYVLTYGSEQYEGKTDNDGMIIQPVKFETGSATLSIDQLTIPIEISPLPEIDKVEGIQARLNNLGYECGKVDGVAGPKTTTAIKNFQRVNNLKVDGIAGPLTKNTLQKACGI